MLGAGLIIYVVEQRQHCFQRKTVASLQVHLCVGVEWCDSNLPVCSGVHSSPFPCSTLYSWGMNPANYIFQAPLPASFKLGAICGVGWVIGKWEGRETTSPPLPTLFASLSPLGSYLLSGSSSCWAASPALIQLQPSILYCGTSSHWEAPAPEIW